MLKRFLLMAVVAVTATFVASSDCKAGYSILLQSGSNSLLITDNNVAPSSNTLDKNLNLGFITTAQTGPGGANTLGVQFANYRFALDSSSGAPDGEVGLFTQTRFRIFNNGATNTLKITVLDDTFTSPGLAGDTLSLTNYLKINSLTAGTGNKVTAYSNASPALATTGVLTGTAAGYENSNSITYHRTGTPYSISQVFEVTLANGGSTSFVGTASVTTPVPSALILAAFGIPAFGLLRRRFASKVEATTAV